MPKRRKISKKTIEAIVELLERIENELPGGIVEVSDDSEEEEVDDGSYMSVDVEVEAVEVAIDGAISEMLDDGLLPKRGSGYYNAVAGISRLSSVKAPRYLSSLMTWRQFFQDTGTQL